MKSLDELIAEDITDVNSRMDAVETFYLTARLNCRELTSGEIDRINSYVLREDLRYNHADKMTLIEYPVMTARQAERRAKVRRSNALVRVLAPAWHSVRVRLFPPVWR